MVISKEPTTFMTRAEVKAILRREKEKASAFVFSLDLNPLYPLEVLQNLIWQDI